MRGQNRSKGVLRLNPETIKPTFTESIKKVEKLFVEYLKGSLQEAELEELGELLWSVDTADRRFISDALKEPPYASTLFAPRESMVIYATLREQLLSKGTLTQTENDRINTLSERFAICYCLDGSIPRLDRLKQAYQWFHGFSCAKSLAKPQISPMWMTEITYQLLVEFGLEEAEIDQAGVMRAREAALDLAKSAQSLSELNALLQRYCEFTLQLPVPLKGSLEWADWVGKQRAAIGELYDTCKQINRSVIDVEETVAESISSYEQHNWELSCRIVEAALVQDDDQLNKVAAALLEESTLIAPRLHNENLRALILTLASIGRAHSAQERGVDPGLRMTIGNLRRADIQMMSDSHFSLSVDFAARIQASNEWLATLDRRGSTPEEEAQFRESGAKAKAKLEAFNPPLLNIENSLVQQAVDEMLSPDSMGRRGLALSGGGLRAACFHVGVMACLADNDFLRKINVLSCVSGGSIAGAAYTVRLKALLAAKHDLEITQGDYREAVADLVSTFTAVAGMNLRAAAFRSPLAVLRMWLEHDYTFTERIADLLDKHLFAPLIRSHPDFVNLNPKALNELAASGKGLTRPSFAVLKSLRDQPIGWPLAMWDLGRPPRFEPSDFEIGSRSNDLRRATCPELLINTTLLNTGGPFLFSTSANGELTRALRKEISKMPTLQWLGYSDINSGGDIDPKAYRLSRAVAASSAVPGLLPPMLFRRTKQKSMLALVDGGVCDNQGFKGLIDQGCNWILVSDAAAQLSFKDFPEVASYRVIASSTDFLMERVREMSYEAAYDLAKQNPNFRFKALHLTRGLADPLPMAAFDLDQSLANQRHKTHTKTAQTDFGVSVTCQTLLANMRTDLDCFSEIEIMSLMANGYMQAKKELLTDGNVNHEAMPSWAFSTAESALSNFDTNGQIARVLDTAKFRFLRLPRIIGHGVTKSRFGRLTLVFMACLLFVMFGIALLLVRPQFEVGQTMQQGLQGILIYAFLLVLVQWLPPNGAKRWLWKLLSLPYLLLAMVHAWIVICISDPIYRRLGKLQN